MKLLFVCLLLAGCTTASPVVGPDGTENQLIRCAAMTSCYSKAREVCGGNYKIVNTTTNTSGVHGSTDTTYEMLVKCDH